jgi:hypothetical protein
MKGGEKARREGVVPYARIRIPMVRMCSTRRALIR